MRHSQPLDANLHQALATLKVPPKTGSATDWDGFCQSLQDILQTHRDIGHDWDLGDEQIERLTYLRANHLLVECLNLAYVSDRAKIEDKLLLPPR